MKPHPLDAVTDYSLSLDGAVIAPAGSATQPQLQMRSTVEGGR
jgi:hypothetical protein